LPNFVSDFVGRKIFLTAASEFSVGRGANARMLFQERVSGEGDLEEIIGFGEIGFCEETRLQQMLQTTGQAIIQFIDE